MTEMTDKSQDALKNIFDYKNLKKPFGPGITPLPVSGKNIDREEIIAITEAALDRWWTSGRFTSQFEKQLADSVGVRFSLFLNSGSSAIHLELSALIRPKLGKKSLQPGD